MEFFRTLYDTENNNLTLEDNYDIKFSNAPSFKMGHIGYLAEIWGYWHPESHTITNNVCVLRSPTELLTLLVKSTPNIMTAHIL